MRRRLNFRRTVDLIKSGGDAHRSGEFWLGFDRRGYLSDTLCCSTRCSILVFSGVARTLRVERNKRVVPLFTDKNLVLSDSLSWTAYACEADWRRKQLI
ncbi:MAG: hypothetical protein JWO48_1508 [Bryobacterales bacterium]|nr:hypothetical protein [Bryobacterales bacterium]